MAYQSVAPIAPVGTPPSLDAPAAAVACPPVRKRRASPTPHLDAGQYERLLAFIDDAGGIATLDAISRSLPRVSQPVSAVFDLCDAGILNVDWECALDADMPVWRVDV